MNKGKRKCEKLKIIRRHIARINGIEYEPAKCDFEGDCPGTCPKCEAELAELQRLLDEKEKRGEKVTRVISEYDLFDYNSLFSITDPSKYEEESSKRKKEIEILYGKDEEEEEQNERNEHGGDEGPELGGIPAPRKYCLTGDYSGWRYMNDDHTTGIIDDDDNHEKAEANVVYGLIAIALGVLCILIFSGHLIFWAIMIILYGIYLIIKGALAWVQE